MTITNAFAESRNIPALKLAARVGIHKVIEMAHRFGVTSNIPAYLPVAIGAVEITLQEQVASYAVFPNDGIRVSPRLVRKVSNADGISLWEDPPTVKEVIDQQTARTMMILLQAVTAHGTGAAAAQLKHPLGGKTGTTSDYTDAWFLGFSPSVTCGVWVGFDNNQSLGDKETGAKAALPIWMTLMRAAIAGKDDEQFLADEKDNPALKAAATPPPRPGSAPSASLPTPGVKATNSPSAPASPAPQAKPAEPTQVRPRTQSSSAPPPAVPQPKPAMLPQAAPVRPAGTVKPAFSVAH
jgi:penicillin-binding protein 1A